LRFLKWSLGTVVLVLILLKGWSYLSSIPGRKVCDSFEEGSDFSPISFFNVAKENGVFLALISDLSVSVPDPSKEGAENTSVRLVFAGKAIDSVETTLKSIDEIKPKGRALATVRVSPGFSRFTCEIEFDQGKVLSKSTRSWD